VPRLRPRRHRSPSASPRHRAAFHEGCETKTNGYA
jgi:hypothetical protein